MYRELKEFTVPPGRQAVTPIVKEPKFKYIADAIRAGCKKAPNQCFGRMFDGWWWNRAACALGAAYHGGVNMTDIPPDVRSRIAWRNDVHRETREQIADWLETL